MQALRDGDTILVSKPDCLGRNLRHLINTVHDLMIWGIKFKILTGQGVAIDTTIPAGKLIFGIFASLVEFERELISERTKEGLKSARTRGHKRGTPYKMTAAKLRLANAAMGHSETKIGPLCKELGATRQPLYRHVCPPGNIKSDSAKLLGKA